MKKFYCTAAFSIFCFLAFAQTAETEPNNNFTTANSFPFAEEFTGTITAGDTVDFFGIDFQYDANFYMYVEVTNNGGSSSTLDFDLYNSLQQNGEYVGNFYSTGYNLDPGGTSSSPINICGKAADSFYLRVKGQGNFSYKITWYPTGANLPGFFNNTIATASPFFFNVSKQEGIRYEFWGNSNYDTIDYFTSTLPPGNYDDVILKINASNYSCIPDKWLKYACYKNGSNIAFDSGYVGNNSMVGNNETVHSLIPLSNMIAGDVLLIKYESNAAFSYNFKYSVPDEFEPDEEYSGDYQNAPTIHENEVFTGNVGEYDYNEDQFVDEEDFYKIILPHDGAIKLFIKGRNDECGSEYYDLAVDVLDHNGNYMERYGLVFWEDYPACGTILLDTTKLRAFVAGTFYLRIHTSGGQNKLSYNIKYQLADSTVGDPNETYGGNNTDVEQIAVGETKKGHIRFKKNAYQYDPQDLYQTNIPTGGSIRVFLKATYRGDYEQYNGSYYNVKFTGFGRTVNFPRSTVVSGFASGSFSDSDVPYLIPDEVYADTFDICGINPGVSNFLIGSGLPYEYEVRYEIIDTGDTNDDIEPNNSFAQATIVPNTALKIGHINYYGGPTPVDTYDYYKVIVGTSDSVKVFIQGTNANCTDGGQLRVKVYNKYHTQIFDKLIASKYFVLQNETITDSIKFFVNAPDTIFLRIEAFGPFNYQFYTNTRKPTSFFKIDGDSTVCLGPQTYIAKNTALPGESVQYNWSLPLGGGTINFVDSVATVDWTSTGNRSVQLILFNAAGNSASKTRTVIVNNSQPTQVPIAFNFARTLSVQDIPAGANAQWYRNSILITGAEQSSYYALLSGTYTVRFINDCGPGPVSNAFSFPEDAAAQSITFPHVLQQTMSPVLKVKLQATASSGLPVFYQKISGPATISNDSLIVTGVGTIIVKALQPGDDVFKEALSKNDTIIVIKGNQTISFDSIPNQIFSGDPIQLFASSSAGQFINYTVLSGNGSVSGNASRLYLTGAGIITVQARQNGNANYNAAAPQERTFCVGVRDITPIIGDANPCLAIYKYATQKIPGATYQWTLSGGGNLTSNNDTAIIQWQTPGSYILKVKVNTVCDPIFSDEQTFNITTSNNAPQLVTNMLPANNSIDQQLPLPLSWIPGANTVNYDLYVWNASAAQPALPYAANINGVTFTLPQNSFAFNSTYKWRVVSKNPCGQTPGPIQEFSLIPLPDLLVSNVLTPPTANSGQTITISWKVSNIGPGNTTTSQTWKDAVFLSFDTLPNFTIPPNVGQNWFAADFPVRTKLLAAVPNLTALNNGQNYTNSVSYTLPINLSTPVYAYVITNYQPGVNAPLEVTKQNDTAHSLQPIIVTLSPTPDLRVDSVFAPLSVFSGSSINITYKVKNYGVLTPAGASWTDRIFMSQSPLFDSATAIKLSAPRWNGSYYPNAGDALGVNGTQLLADSFVTRSVQAIIPNFIFGTWFIYVKANSSNTLYEGALSNNNINQIPIQVYLTPTPRLTITNLNLPVTSASTTQPIGVNWNIFNEGLTDNIEKNKGHYFERFIGFCPCTCYGCGAGQQCVGPKAYFDSTAAGSSFWIDKTYLSTDSSGLNLGNAILVSTTYHGTEYSGYYVFDNVPRGATSCDFYGPQNIGNVINPGSNFPTTANFNVPDNLQQGNYYVYVYTNPNKTVFEYPGTAQIKRSDVPITVQRPDLIAPVATVPANVLGAQTFPITYTVTNNGLGAVFNHLRRDKIYVSNFPNFDASAQLISTQTYTESLPVGVAVSHTVNYSFSAATTGNKYFYVHTNFDSSFRETNSFNNISASAATNVTAAIAADLVVSNIIIADTITTLAANRLIYTVTNNGPGATTGTWTDSVYISCSPTFNFTSNNFLVKKEQTRVIATGASYTDTIDVSIQNMSPYINTCFPLVANFPAYVFVKTNATNSLYEGPNSNNNVKSSGLKILKNPLVDHIVTSVIIPQDTVTVGQSIFTNFTIKNIGSRPYYNYYHSWYDGLYYSLDSVFSADDILGSSFYQTTPFIPNGGASFAKQTAVPNIASGNYYILINTNHNNTIYGEIAGNNVNFARNASGAARKIYVVRPLLPDLVDSVLFATNSVAVGQQISFKHQIKNIGAGVTYPYSFTNKLWLSTDFVTTDTIGDKLLSAKIQNTILSPGQFYSDSVVANIPLNTVPGNYILKSKVNGTGNVFESNSSNNYSFSLLSIYSPPPTDLLVQNIINPDTVFLGYTIDTLKWVIKNNSSNTATGISSDGVYISSSNMLDSSAKLLGIKNKTLNMPALTADTIRMAPLVNSVKEGNYNIIVKTDLLNNIVESNKDNNVSVSSTPIYVAVKTLPLNVLTPNTLQTNGRYYKLVIPDSLRASTIKITLKTNDSSLVRNEMYVGANFIPSNAMFTYKFEIPNYGNQQIVMTDVYDSVYYIFYRCVSPNSPLQNVTIKAEKLPFSILNVNSASGGNIGNVTVKLSGSLFRDSMTAKLSNGAGTINASAVYFTNSTLVYATFNLAGKPLGLYNVTLTKPDNSEATMANGFSIVPANNGGLFTGGGVNSTPGNGNEPGCDPGAASGLNSQLVIDLVVPEKVVVNWPFTIQINYTNPTNGDIPAQSRILYSELGEKLSLTQAGVASGTTSLYLELVEQGGPPGIIRAGGSGTINVYSKSPSFLTNGYRKQEGNFKLK